MESQRIADLQKKLEQNNLNKICSSIAQKIKNDIVQEIESETKLVVGNRITVDENSVTINGTRIPIEEFNPQFTPTSVSRQSVLVDKSLLTGEQLLRKTFFNPKRNIIRQRTTQKAYPIFKVYGPSAASLYKQKQQQFEIDQQIIVQEELKEI